MRRGLEPRETDDGLAYAAALVWPAWLDLYAGSGALGIEALSRGAERVDFVERSADARTVIGRNLERTGLAERGRVRGTTAERLSAAPEQRYDVVLLDPPYAEVGPEEALARLDEARLLRPGGLAVLEHARDRPAPEQVGGLRLLRTRSHGRSSISLYETTAEE